MKQRWTQRMTVWLVTVLLALPATAAPREAAAQPARPAAQSDAAPAQQQPDSTSQPASGESSSQSGTATPAVGTAAAPYEKSSGVTASRPAGAVIAPAKQHRVRRIFIGLGIVVGAGVALGTVAALSHASPSQPH